MALVCVLLNTEIGIYNRVHLLILALKRFYYGIAGFLCLACISLCIIDVCICHLLLLICGRHGVVGQCNRPGCNLNALGLTFNLIVLLLSLFKFCLPLLLMDALKLNQL